MRGRKPKSTLVKLLQGNRGKRPLKRNAGLFQQRLPDKPLDLNNDASEEWDRLTTSLKEVLSTASRGMLLVAVTAYADFMAASRTLSKRGSTYKTTGPSGTLIRQRPEVRMKENARRDYRQALAELGASPVSQNRVNRLPPPPDRSGVARFFEDRPPVTKTPRTRSKPGEEGGAQPAAGEGVAKFFA